MYNIGGTCNLQPYTLHILNIFKKYYAIIFRWHKNILEIYFIQNFYTSDSDDVECIKDIYETSMQMLD